MRIKNSLKNIIYGLSGQIISILMAIILRTIFVYTLGIEYLGIEGLFTSILLMLSLANLGFDTAMIYSLYKPLAEKNIKKIKALMNMYKKSYKIIGIIVLLIGLALLPFLPHLLNGADEVDFIYIIYLLFLINSVSSYFLVYNHSIIIADQRNYIISKIHSVFLIISNLIQICLLLVFKSYILILLMQISLRIIENAYVANKAFELYPYLKGKNNEELDPSEKRVFFNNLYSLFLYKISGVVINGTDSIVISLFIGISAVGVYSNYLLIIATITTLVSYIFYSITASVGNLIITEVEERKYFIFRVINFLNFWVYGFCIVCLWNLLNPFISLWLGEQYLFNTFIVFAILLNFYTAGMQNASTTFRETTGLFKKGKYRPVFAAIINIVATIILTKLLGIAGVFLGTVISRLLTYFWYDPYIIFKLEFKKSARSYFIRYVWFGILVILACLISSSIIRTIYLENEILLFLVKMAVSFLIPNLLFLIIFCKSAEYIYIFNIFSNIVLGLLKKLRPAKSSFYV